ncbi:Gfo/Idh/MocA family protein [Edaphobacter acidisoli]|uniref:Gfo/Idh/MocA family protein n=1 Tax=Edaphobacter acidisoli TaxID=2040573 RepID=UPI001E2FF822|nr:Gfo/Idh/MocA family oxidoreductase [Edaphobacter acidisoli]
MNLARTQMIGGLVINFGVIGYGYWGPNLVRNLFEVAETQLIAVSDMREDRLQQVVSRYPSVEITTDYRHLLENPNIDAIAIATPVSTHYELALQALEHGKHVIVEKPMTSTSEQASHLIEEARRRKLTLLVDHTFVYTGAVRKIKEIVSSGELGDVLYYDSTRINLGLFQRDVDVIWDLAVHDLAIMDYILPSSPCAVAATGINHLFGGVENLAYLTMFFDENVIAHVNVNWLSPVKVRRTLVGGSKQMVVYDDMEPSEKIKVYDKGVTVNGSRDSVYKALVGYRSGDMYAPHLDVSEALKVEIQHFVECIRTGAEPITGGQAGLRVVRILESASRSMKHRGRLVDLRPPVPVPGSLLPHTLNPALNPVLTVGVA